MFGLTFLNSAFLIGLLGALLPLLIHLLNRRRIKVIPFSTLKYLSPLQKKQMRRMRIREILLLIIRMLIIAFLALAMARPAFQGEVGGDVGAHTTTSVVIVLDDSYSMDYEGSNGTLFGQARERAQTLVEMLNESDDANLIYVSQPESPVFDKPTHNFTLLSEIIGEREVSAATGDLITSLNTAHQIIDESINLNKEVYLISDLQTTAWDTVEAVLPEFREKNRLFVIDVGQPSPQNIYLESVDYSNQLLFADRPIRFTSAIFNASDNPVDNQLLQLYVNGVKKSQVGVSVAPGSMGHGKVSVTFPEAKDYNGYVEIPDDPLLMDNRRYFTVDIKGEVRALILSDDPDGEQKNRFYVENVLNPLQKGETRITPTAKPTAELGATRLDDYQVIILSNVSSLSEGQMAMLSTFVEEGGGLLTILGDKSDVRFYNETFLPVFLPAQIKSLRGGDQSAFFSWDDIDYEHYIFQVFDPDEATFESLQFSRTYEILPQAGTNVLVTYNNQMPALLSHQHGYGFVALLPTSLDNTWNNLPIRSSFVPLMHRTVQFLGLGDSRSRNVDVGSPVVHEVESIPFGAEVACIKPSGDVVKVSPEIKSGKNMLRFTETDQPGIYTWRVGNEIIGQFAVNVNTAESDLNRLQSEQLAAFFPEQNLVLIDGGQSLQDKVLQVRYGRELWKFFLWIVFILLLLELLLAWSLGREKKLDTAPAAA